MGLHALARGEWVVRAYDEDDELAYERGVDVRRLEFEPSPHGSTPISAKTLAGLGLPIDTRLDHFLDFDAVERPEDCNKPCWRHVDGGSQCECDDETEGGTWQPGC